jgi:hypothetical protein
VGSEVRAAGLAGGVSGSLLNNSKRPATAMTAKTIHPKRRGFGCGWTMEAFDLSNSVARELER